jgi:flavin reductase (DIM6/NTAB) family NADH-FMN oxidoreductase RutF
MQFDFAELAPRDRYKLLVSFVVPRPIAFVTSLNQDGLVNAAPFSFFNVVGSDPPLIVLGISNRPAGSPKDTAYNIRQSHEFVVNIVDEALAKQMNICATDFPPEISEVEAAQLHLQPSIIVTPPRIAASPVNFECREHTCLEIGNNRVILGEVLYAHMSEDVIDSDTLYIKPEAFHPIGRMHGGGWYTKTNDQFEIPRITYEEWQKQ